MRYCGVVPSTGFLQLAMLEEVRTPEPPIRLEAVFFEPGSAAQIASELISIGDLVIAVGALRARGAERACDAMLRERGVPPAAADPEATRLYEALEHMGVFAPASDASEGQVAEGAYHDAPVFETNTDGVFCALQGRRLPAKRHPLGIQLRIRELEQDQVQDADGLWNRRIEEIEAAGAALCAHRYAVGHACWLGHPSEGVVVLPGTAVPPTFTTRGVLPPVERLRLPQA
jgi:hypothetical protein